MNFISWKRESKLKLKLKQSHKPNQRRFTTKNTNKKAIIFNFNTQFNIMDNQQFSEADVKSNHRSQEYEEIMLRKKQEMRPKENS